MNSSHQDRLMQRFELVQSKVTRRNRMVCVVALIGLLGMTGSVQASEPLLVLNALPKANVDTENRVEPEAVLHSNLVKSALLNDAFGKRCRGRSLAKYVNMVNRLFITKYSVSVNNYIETYIAPDYRTYKDNFEQLFNRALVQKGGCDTAKEQHWDKQMSAEFNQLYQQVEASNWYPQIERY